MKKDLETISGQGIKVRISGGRYQPLHIVPGHPAVYWDPEFRVPLLREELKGVFPEVTRDGDSVVFRVLDDNQRDILSHSRQAQAIPPRERKKLQDAIDKLHSRADDPDTAITEDRRQFYRNFRLPDPAVMPECWRITGPFFRKRLYVLWGFENANRSESTFLPQSKNARLHSDTAEWSNTKRQGIPDAIRGLNRGWLGWLSLLLKGLFVLLMIALILGLVGYRNGCIPRRRSENGGQGPHVTTNGVPGPESQQPNGEGKDTDNAAISDGRVEDDMNGGNPASDETDEPDVWQEPLVTAPGDSDSVSQPGDEVQDPREKPSAVWDDSGIPGAMGGTDMDEVNPAPNELTEFGGGAEPPVTAPDDSDAEPQPGDEVQDPREKPSADGDDSGIPGAMGGTAMDEVKPAPHEPNESGGGSEPTVTAPDDSGAGLQSGDEEQNAQEIGDEPFYPEETGENAEQANEGIDSEPPQANEAGQGMRDTPPVSKPEVPRSGQPSDPAAYTYTFQVTAKKVGGDSENAFMEFSVVSTASVRGRAVEVSDWSVNQKIEKTGVNPKYKAKLKYNRNYTISATVKVDGVPQKVRPYQWNMTDDPTWQIVLRGHGRKDEAKELYELLCCNSSSVKPRVLHWTPEFGDANGKLGFDVKSEQTGETTFEMAQNIGFKRGVYRLQLTADIAYEDTARGVTGRTTHCETIPFVHDTSTEGLNTAKYQVAIPNIYFCLARLEDGGEHNGTAFAVSKKRLLTNYHVAVGGVPGSAAGDADYRVEKVLQLTNWRGKTYHAKVEKADAMRDLALLVLCDRNGADTSDELPGYLHLAPDSMLKAIENQPRLAFSVGYPAGTVPMGPPAYSDGKVEKLEDRSEGGGEGIETLVNYTDIKPGYSGGPLIDYKTGQILGVNFGGEISGGTAFGKPASFATSVREVRKCFPELQESGKTFRGASAH